MKATVVAVVGNKKTGKTTAIEVLTRVLSKRGHRVAAVKHIPEPDFTIDEEGKDTWRFAQAGAKTIISVSSDEIATIEKVKTKNFSLDAILQKCEGNDLIFVEGFRKLVDMNRDVPKIVVVESAEEALKAAKSIRPIVAFTGPYSTEGLGLSIPYADVLKNPERIGDILERLTKGN